MQVQPHSITSFAIGSSQQNEEFESVVFLITVNDTWQDCMATVKTPNMAPNVPRNETTNILVGDCDSGPLVYQVTQSFGRYKDYILYIVLVAQILKKKIKHILYSYSSMVIMIMLGIKRH